MAQYKIHKPTGDSSKTIAFLNGEIGEDILKAEYSRVIAKVNQLDAVKKMAILAVCLSALSGPQSRGNEAARIAAVRAIVALLPMSLGAIADLLNRRLNWHHYEVHFTLLVVVSRVLLAHGYAGCHLRVVVVQEQPQAVLVHDL